LGVVRKADFRLMSDPSTPQGNRLPGHTGLAPEPKPQRPPASVDPAPAEHSLTRGQIWIHRLLVLLFVFVCAAAGVLLVVLPWTPQWTDNSLLLRYPDLRTIITNGFFRGLCSGLGLLDIWIGFSEAIHYHEDRLP
jgi:hypothetical protein